MSKINTFDKFALISTNQDYNLLHDVTRDDIVDIINNIFTVSKASTINTILETILAHTTPQDDPHGLTMDQLKEKVIDRVYTFWLDKGYNGTLDEFRDMLYNWITYANVMHIVQAVLDDHFATSAKDTIEYFTGHHTEVIDSYLPVAKMTLSEKNHHWSGVLSGVELQTNQTLHSVPDTDPTIWPNKNGDVWYTWSVTIPKLFWKADLKIQIYTNHAHTLSYKMGEYVPDWTRLNTTVIESDVEHLYTDTVVYQSSSIDLFDITILPPDVANGEVELDYITPYRYPLPTNVEKLLISRKSMGEEVPDFTIERWRETVTINFKLEFGENTQDIKIEDVLTVIDASNSWTDDPFFKELYRDPPHANLFEPLLSVTNDKIYSDPTFSWSHVISHKFNQGRFIKNNTNFTNSPYITLRNQINWFNEKEGSILLTVQPNTNIISEVEDPIYRDVSRTCLSIIGDETSVIRISTICGGMYERKLERNRLATNTNRLLTFDDNITKMSRLDSLKYQIRVISKNIKFTINTPNLKSMVRPLWKLLFVYSTMGNIYTLYYISNNGKLVSNTHYSPKVLKFDMSKWYIYKPAIVSDNSFVGVHQLDYYDTAIIDLDIIRDLLYTDISIIPPINI